MNYKEKKDKLANYDVIIVNFNGEKIISECLDSVYSNTLLPSKVIIYDNNSSDGSVESISSKYPNAILIRGKKNIGFGRANNEAIKQSDAEFILFMNNDVILDKKFSKVILEGFRDSQLAIMNSLIYKGWVKKGNQEIYAFGAEMNRSGFNYGLYDLGENRDDLNSFSAACCMIRSKVIKELKFEKRFFLYGEEAEISARILKRGLKIGRTKEAVCYHLESYSSSNNENKNGLAFRQFYAVQNRWYMLGKDWPFRLWPEALLFSFFHLIFILFFYLKNGKYSYLSLLYVAPSSFIQGIRHRDKGVAVNKKWHTQLSGPSILKYFKLGRKVFSGS